MKSGRGKQIIVMIKKPLFCFYILPLFNPCHWRTRWMEGHVTSVIRLQTVCWTAKASLL